MKKSVLTMLHALPLLSLGLITSISFHVVNANSSTFTEQSVAADQNVIYDKDGNRVPLFDVSSQEPVIENRGLNQPTAVKRLSKGQSYQSSNFSGTGMRYGGYMFGITGNAKNIKFSVKKGAFTCYITDRPDPSAVVQYSTVTPSGSPYHAAFHGYIYFGAYNPAPGQNYFIQAY